MNRRSSNLSINGIAVNVTSDEEFGLRLHARDMLRENVVAALSYTSCKTNMAIRRILKEKRVPYLDISPCPCEYHYAGRESAANVTYHGRYPVSDAVLSVVQRERWKDAVVIHDDMYDAEVIRDVLDTLLAWGISVAVVNRRHSAFLHDNKDAFLQNRHFIVMCSFNNTRSIFKQIRWGYLSLLGPYYFWLLVGDHTRSYPHTELSEVLIDGDNVAVIRYKGLKNHQTALVTEITLNLWNAVHHSLHASAASGNESDATNGDMRSANSSNHYMDFIKNYTFLLNSQHHCSHFEVFSARLQQYGGMLFSHVADWDYTRHLRTHYHLFPGKYEGYNNRTFRVVTKEFSAFSIKHENGTYHGICMELLDTLSRRLNFSYILDEPADNVWGVRQENGSFNGLVGMLQRKEIDLVVAALSINWDRQKVVDFTIPYWEEGNIIILQKPDIASSKVFICLDPFKWEVWTGISLSVLVTGFVVWLLARMTPLYRKPTVRRELCDIQMNLWQVFGALLQQGMVFVPESQSGRFLVASWWFYVLVVAGTYNGNLIAFLTAPSLRLQVDSVKALANSNLDIGFETDSATHQMLKDARSGVFKKLFDKVKGRIDSMPSNLQQGLSRIENDRMFAYIAMKSDYETLHLSDTPGSYRGCQFARADDTFLKQSYAFAMQKNSPYTQTFSLTMMRILEAGLLERWKNEWYSFGNECSGLERSAGQTTLALSETQGAFYILGLGIVLSAIALSCERLAYHVCRRRQRLQEKILKQSVNGIEVNHNLRMTRVGRIDALPPFSGSMNAKSCQNAYDRVNDANSIPTEVNSDQTIGLSVIGAKYDVIGTNGTRGPADSWLEKHKDSTACNGVVKDTTLEEIVPNGYDRVQHSSEFEKHGADEQTTRHRRPHSVNASPVPKLLPSFVAKRHSTYPIPIRHCVTIKQAGESEN